MLAAGSMVVDARRCGGDGAPPALPLGRASGPGLTVLAVMPDDAAIRWRGRPRPGCGGPRPGVRPVIGRPNPWC